MRAVEDLATLRDRIDQGEAFEYLCFFGHQPPKQPGLSKSCFSQWWAGPFDADGVTYATAEHYMMAGKARLFGDAEMLAEILASTDPGKAKALGRKVRGFDQSEWEAHRLEIVTAGNVAKFDQDDEYRAFLIGTGNKVLVEAAPRDRIWGIGLGANHEDARNPRRWRGRNLLGFALMRARAHLSSRSST